MFRPLILSYTHRVKIKKLCWVSGNTLFYNFWLILINFIQDLSFFGIFYLSIASISHLLSSNFNSWDELRARSCQMSSGRFKQVKLNCEAFNHLLPWYKQYKQEKALPPWLISADAGIFSLLKEPPTKGCWNFIDPGAKEGVRNGEVGSVRAEESVSKALLQRGVLAEVLKSNYQVEILKLEHRPKCAAGRGALSPRLLAPCSERSILAVRGVWSEEGRFSVGALNRIFVAASGPAGRITKKIWARMGLLTNAFHC